MKPLNIKYQNGIALLIFVVVLMGIGGFVLIGYNQGLLKEVEAKRFEHNQRVLKEAKQALLQFTYNHPVNTPDRGPGRLPCPDTNNDGGRESFTYCKNVTGIVGRFPWLDAEMNFYDARDASGERLWYAVSQNFAYTGPPKINSDTVGTITIFDQSGNIKNNGATGDGVAAVIIAPGPELAGQDRNAGVNDPANFLDSFNGFNNSILVNSGIVANDGFILGPVFDQAQNASAINDQIIVITAAEVIEMAEKATLQAYRNAINDYLASTGGVYPWLYSYDNILTLDEFPTDLNFATEFANYLGPPGNPQGNIGRIPSIFSDYFTEPTSQPIDTQLDISWSMLFPLTPATVASSASGLLQFNGICTGEVPPLDPPTNAANCNANGGVFSSIPVAFNFTTVDLLTDVQFVNIADIVGQDGRLTATVGVGDEQLFTQEFYFWDYDEVAPSGIWTLCEDDGDLIPEFTDCNRTAGVPNPGGTQDTNSEILHVIVEFDFNSSGAKNFDINYAIPPAIAAPVAADGNNHATISATYSGASIINSPLTVRYEIDRHYHTTFDIQESGTLDFADLGLTMTVGMRYYPELPDWAFSNGWYDSVMMAYAAKHAPGVAGDCTPGADCIQIDNFVGNNDNKISILTLAGQHNWADDAPLGDFTNDITDVFDAENADILDVDGTEYLFDKRESGGNDKIIVIEEI